MDWEWLSCGGLGEGLDYSRGRMRPPGPPPLWWWSGSWGLEATLSLPDPLVLTAPHAPSTPSEPEPLADPSDICPLAKPWSLKNRWARGLETPPQLLPWGCQASCSFTPQPHRAPVLGGAWHQDGRHLWAGPRCTGLSPPPHRRERVGAPGAAGGCREALPWCRPCDRPPRGVPRFSSQQEADRRYPYRDQLSGGQRSPRDKRQGPGWWDSSAPGPRPLQGQWSVRPGQGVPLARESEARGPAPVSRATWVFPDLEIPFPSGERGL